MLLTPLPAPALSQPVDSLQIGDTRPVSSVPYIPDPTDLAQS